MEGEQIDIFNSQQSKKNEEVYVDQELDNNNQNFQQQLNLRSIMNDSQFQQNSEYQDQKQDKNNNQPQCQINFNYSSPSSSEILAQNNIDQFLKIIKNSQKINTALQNGQNNDIKLIDSLNEMDIIDRYKQNTFIIGGEAIIILNDDNIVRVCAETEEKFNRFTQFLSKIQNKITFYSFECQYEKSIKLSFLKMKRFYDDLQQFFGDSRGSLNNKQVIKVLSNLLIMLNELRINNIFHSDIKLKNIVLDEFVDEIKLIDFGMMQKLIGLNNELEQLIGITFLYSSEEVIHLFKSNKQKSVKYLTINAFHSDAYSIKIIIQMIIKFISKRINLYDQNLVKVFSELELSIPERSNNWDSSHFLIITLVEQLIQYKLSEELQELAEIIHTVYKDYKQQEDIQNFLYYQQFKYGLALALLKYFTFINDVVNIQKLKLEVIELQINLCLFKEAIEFIVKADYNLDSIENNNEIIHLYYGEINYYLFELDLAFHSFNLLVTNQIDYNQLHTSHERINLMFIIGMNCCLLLQNHKEDLFKQKFIQYNHLLNFPESREQVENNFPYLLVEMGIYQGLHERFIQDSNYFENSLNQYDNLIECSQVLFPILKNKLYQTFELNKLIENNSGSHIISSKIENIKEQFQIQLIQHSHKLYQSESFEYAELVYLFSDNFDSKFFNDNLQQRNKVSTYLKSMALQYMYRMVQRQVIKKDNMKLQFYEEKFINFIINNYGDYKQNFIKHFNQKMKIFKIFQSASNNQIRLLSLFGDKYLILFDLVEDKVLKIRFTKDELKFIQELAVVNSIEKKKNIAEYDLYYQKDNYDIIVMKHYKRSLIQDIEIRKLNKFEYWYSQKEIIYLIYDGFIILNELKYNQIIHSNIKNTNLLIDKEGKLCITGFSESYKEVKLFNDDLTQFGIEYSNEAFNLKKIFDNLIENNKILLKNEKKKTQFQKNENILIQMRSYLSQKLNDDKWNQTEQLPLKLIKLLLEKNINFIKAQELKTQITKILEVDSFITDQDIQKITEVVNREIQIILNRYKETIIMDFELFKFNENEIMKIQDAQRKYQDNKEKQKNQLKKELEQKLNISGEFEFKNNLSLIQNVLEEKIDPILISSENNNTFYFPSYSALLANILISKIDIISQLMMILENTDESLQKIINTKFFTFFNNQVSQRYLFIPQYIYEIESSVLKEISKADTKLMMIFILVRNLIILLEYLIEICRYNQAFQILITLQKYNNSVLLKNNSLKLYINIQKLRLLYIFQDYGEVFSQMVDLNNQHFEEIYQNKLIQPYSLFIFLIVNTGLYLGKEDEIKNYQQYINVISQIDQDCIGYKPLIIKELGMYYFINKQYQKSIMLFDQAGEEYLNVKQHPQSAILKQLKILSQINNYAQIRQLNQNEQMNQQNEYEIKKLYNDLRESNSINQILFFDNYPLIYQALLYMHSNHKDNQGANLQIEQQLSIVRQNLISTLGVFIEIKMDQK